MQLLTSVSSIKTPLNGDAVIITPLLPGSNDGSNALNRRQALEQALTGQHTQFKLGHVQPTAMLGYVMELQPSHDPSSFLGLKRLIQRGWRVRIQVIQQTRIRGASGKCTSTSSFIACAKSCLVRRLVTSTCRQPTLGSRNRNRL